MPVTTGLNATTCSPRASSAAAIDAATTVLPTPVSVPVTKRPRRAPGPSGRARDGLAVEHADGGNGLLLGRAFGLALARRLALGLDHRRCDGTRLRRHAGC